MQIASSAVRYTASVISLLDELGKTVSLYAEYEGMFAAHPRFQNALVDVFVDIIGVLAKARKVFSKSSKPALAASPLRSRNPWAKSGYRVGDATPVFYFYL